MKIETGRPFYGQKVGILVFSTDTPRIPGDAGNADTFAYQVRYEVIQGGFADLIHGSAEIRQRIIDGCLNLKRNGIRAVLGDCGMMSLYQHEIGKEADLLFAGSALVQIPLVWQLIGRSGSIGIITGHSEMLGMEHLMNSGWTPDIRLSIQGMEDEAHFAEIVINGGHDIDVARMEQDVLNAGRKLKEKTPDLKAVILECSNLPSYARSLQEDLDVPVFDIISTANLLEYGVNPTVYY